MIRREHDRPICAPGEIRGQLEGDPLEMGDEARDRRGVEPPIDGALGFLLEAPAPNGVEVGDAQEHERLELAPQGCITPGELGVRIPAPDTVCVLVSLEAVARAHEGRVDDGPRTDTPALEQDEIEGTRPAPGPHAVVAALVEDRHLDVARSAEREQMLAAERHIVGPGRTAGLEEGVDAASEGETLLPRQVVVVERDHTGTQAGPIARLHEEPRKSRLARALSARDPDSPQPARSCVVGQQRGERSEVPIVRLHPPLPPFACRGRC